jgi:hypothetical protein
VPERKLLCGGILKPSTRIDNLEELEEKRKEEGSSD